MKRGTTHQKTDELLKKFREYVPEMAIRTTLIVGFPGDTEENFLELKNWVASQRFDRLGCFTYSHEENTTAFLLNDNVPEETKMQRVNEIMELQSQISWELNQQKIGKTFNCIIDRKDGDYYIARTEFDSPDVDNEVLIDATQNYLSIGNFYPVKITSAEDFDLYGDIVE
jgi:ribosomal protein S12 methylthiotransferase